MLDRPLVLFRPRGLKLPETLDPPSARATDRDPPRSGLPGLCLLRTDAHPLPRTLARCLHGRVSEPCRTFEFAICSFRPAIAAFHPLRVPSLKLLRAMATAVAIPMPMSPRDERHMPVLSTLDPSFSPSSLHLQPYTKPKRSPSMQPSPDMRTSPTSSFSSTKSHDQDMSFSPSSPPRCSVGVPMGSRHERVPYDGPGMAVYVRQPTRAQLVSPRAIPHPRSNALPAALSDSYTPSNDISGRITDSSDLRAALITIGTLRRNQLRFASFRPKMRQIS